MSDWDKPTEDMVNEMLDRKIQIKAQAKEIEKLRAALWKIEYLDRPQVRGLPRRVTIQEIALAALGEKE